MAIQARVGASLVPADAVRIGRTWERNEREFEADLESLANRRAERRLRLIAEPRRLGAIARSRRRAAAAAALALAICVLVGVVNWAYPADGVAGEMRLAHSILYTVHAGDTVWAIAAEVAGDADPRPVVAAILDQNPRARDGLSPGMPLRLPKLRADAAVGRDARGENR